MANQLHRSDDWARLKNSGFLVVQDEPGRITVSRTSQLEKNINMLAIGAPAVTLVVIMLGGMLGGTIGTWVTILMGGFTCGMILVGGVLPAKKTMGQMANKIVYAPKNVYFLRDNTTLGSLPREALQQILADKDDNGLLYHRYLADVGYVSAFPHQDKADHLIINNILIVAFQQPVHLDLDAGEYDAPVGAGAGAPQIVGLQPAKGPH